MLVLSGLVIAPEPMSLAILECAWQAHNLADAVNNANSALLTLSQANTAHNQLAAYLQRYGSQMKPGKPAGQIACTDSTLRRFHVSWYSIPAYLCALIRPGFPHAGSIMHLQLCWTMQASDQCMAVQRMRQGSRT